MNRELEKGLPFTALTAEMANSFKLRECLHPKASSATCSKVVGAHTIQRSAVLSRIIDDTGHCYSFYPGPNIEGPIAPKKRGWRDASTFRGFCASHDQSTFAPLETSRFEGTPEQCFLLAYRAQCHELYQKQAAARTRKKTAKLVDRGRRPEAQREIQAIHSSYAAYLGAGLAEAQSNKVRMDRELLGKRYSDYRQLFVIFDGDISVVSTGCITPNKTLGGTELFDFDDLDTPIQPLYLGVVPTDTGGGVVLLWRTVDDVPGQIVTELKGIERDRLASMIVQFMFAYLENTFFSIRWWDSLVRQQQAMITRLAVMGDPYTTRWNFHRGPLVPWKIQTVTEVWPKS